MDMRLPGMVYAVVARPPVVGGKLRRYDPSQTMAVPGVIKVVEVPDMSGAPGFQPLGGVAVVARNTWAARQGRTALKIEWDDGTNANYDSVDYRQTLESAARKSGKIVRDQGDVAQAWSRAPEAERLVAEYHVPHLAHASMEPPVATALVTGDTCEIWTSVQNPQAALDGAAAALGMGRRALHEAIAYSRNRSMFGGQLADFQLTQARLGEMSSLRW